MKKAVLISCFNWYEKRLAIIRERLLVRGYEVTVLLSDFDHLTKSPISPRFEECTYIEVPPYQKNLSLARARSHLSFGQSVGAYVSDLAPDLIYALIPPNNVAKHCLAYKKQHPEVIYMVDVIDLWPESMPLSLFKTSWLARKWAQMRQESLAVADAIVLECDLYRKVLVPHCQTPHIKTLRLFSDYGAEDLALAKQVSQAHVFQAASKAVKLAYIGSLNSLADYEGILAIVKAFLRRGWQVAVHVIGDGQQRARFITSLEETGCQVLYHGLVFDQGRKIDLVGDCDFAFNMMTKHVAVGLTMKSLDYLSLGLPMINSIQGDTWDLVERQGIGLNYSGDPDNLVSRCESMDYPKMRRRVTEILEKDFTQEAFEKQVEDCLASVLD